MNKKVLKLVPATLLVAMVATSCGKKYTPVNALDAFVRGLSGEVTGEQLNGLWEEGVLDAGDNQTTAAQYQQEEYHPMSAYNVSGKTDEEIAEIVYYKVSQGSYKVYGNNVIEIKDQVFKRPYNPEHAADDKIAINTSDEAIQQTADTALIYENGDLVNYVYTRDGNPADAWSFVAKRDNDAGLMDELKHQGGISADTLALFAEVQEYYSYYYSAWGGDLVDSWSVDKGTVKDGKLSYTWEQAMDFWGMYSAECYWGSEYAGFYVKMYYSYYFNLEIENGIITLADAGFMGVKRQLLQDRNWKQGDPTPGEDLTPEQITAMDLYMPEKVNGEDNPYTGDQYLTVTAYDAYTVAASGKEWGSYTKSLPDVSGYRDVADDDEGSWINVQDFLNWEAE